jgi:spermidine synthase
VFENVIILPGEKNHFLASDAPLTYDIAERVLAKGIENRYVNSYYIDDSLLKMRGETILSALNLSAEVNTNLNPVLYQQQLAFWLSQFNGKYWLMAALAGALALFVFLCGSTPSQVMFLTGFSASGLEILLLFGLQAYFGNIYLLTSFVFSGFMFGLAAGSFFGKSFPDKNYLAVTQLLIGGFAASIGIVLFSSGMADLAPAFVYLLCLSAIVLIGLFTGFQFTQVSQNRTGNYAEISGKTYSYDLVGSALGAFVVSVFMVPGLGILESVLIIALTNFVFGIWLILKS